MIVLTSNGGATAARLSDVLLISAFDSALAGRESVATRISQLPIIRLHCLPSWSSSPSRFCSFTLSSRNTLSRGCFPVLSRVRLFRCAIRSTRFC
jgi:hypothetical protein